MCCLGADYFAAVQNNKDTVLFWTWHKDQVVQRSFAQEKLTALAASTCGALLAGGGASGTVYMWETASGRLLRSWPAHYKAVTCLAFTCSASLLVSGSEDTLVSSWLLHDLLDASQDLGSPADSRPLPLHSWSSHSLPVTALALGAAGHEAAGLVASASLDRSVKLHRLSDGALLATVALPVAATAVVVDAGEHALYVGGADGSVYEVSLVGEVADLQQQQPNGTGGSQLGAQRPSWLQAGGAGLGESGALLHPHARMAAHSREVTALAMSLDGELLVSGSEDGSAVVWDLRSRQPLHTLTTPFKLPLVRVELLTNTNVTWVELDKLVALHLAPASTSDMQAIALLTLRNIARCNLDMLLERGHLIKVLPFITSPDRPGRELMKTFKGLLTQLVALLSNQADGLDTGYACLAVANWAMQAEVKAALLRQGAVPLLVGLVRQCVRRPSLNELRTVAPHLAGCAAASALLTLSTDAACLDAMVQAGLPALSEEVVCCTHPNLLSERCRVLAAWLMLAPGPGSSRSQEQAERRRQRRPSRGSKQVPPAAQQEHPQRPQPAGPMSGASASASTFWLTS
ncbi:uncharacterized protein HaLaN_18880 [Haematococcus lacustris]|uniref:WD_REPEATS_REGION domain-containing protein n=1 Tax=Haematococcus lacustris TaxID=44745 RepID=A0A699ZH59_HAELA|nr:uncharacterized protein HaLaN_18880 [Haematococcus lacustris]